MRYRKTEIWKSVDWFTILLYTLMVVAGWFSICGASYAYDDGFSHGLSQGAYDAKVEAAKLKINLRIQKNPV